VVQITNELLLKEIVSGNSSSIHDQTLFTIQPNSELLEYLSSENKRVKKTRITSKSRVLPNKNLVSL